MDLAGFNWTLITIVGAVVLAILIAVAKLRNRQTTSSEDVERSEAATRRVYEEEEREHHGESDNVP